MVSEHGWDGLYTNMEEIQGLRSFGLENRSNWYVVGLRGMDISPIRVVRAQCCAVLIKLRWGIRVPQQRRQGVERSEVDARSIRDAPVRAYRSVEHPGRYLQPPML